MPKPPVPDTPKTDQIDRRRFDISIKENIELLTGRRGRSIKKLSATASTNEIIGKINELIDWLMD